MDQGEFALDEVYQFDEAIYTKVIMYIKDNIIGTAWGFSDPALRTAPWPICIHLAEERKFTAEETYRAIPALRPHPLNAGEVSLILKNKIAYRRILDGGFDYAIIAEDDIVFNADSEAYLSKILKLLPHDFDYVDLAGAFSPRVGNRLVNLHFYEIDPPRPRQVCCVIVRKSLVERFLEIDPPWVGGMDWMLLYLFRLIRAKVYWVEPLVFRHGSLHGTYRSNLMPAAGS
jgi:hypothetical protein